MLSDIIIILIISLITFLPILLWGYLFSLFDYDNINKKLFYVWLFVWWFSVVPVLFLDDFFANFLWFLNFFQNIFIISSVLWFFKFFIWLFFLSFFIWVLYLTLFAWFVDFKNKIKKFLRGFYFFIPVIFLFSIFILFINLFFSFFPKLNFSSDLFWVSFWDNLFNTFKLVIFYYLLMAFLEEISKFFWYKYSSYQIISISIKKSVLFWIFVALWFSFIENILYFNSLYMKYGISWELVSSYFLRSLLSVSVHVLSTSIFVYFFSKYFFYNSGLLNYKMIYYLFIWFMLSILIHAIFNISTTLNITLISFSYIFFRYFYITYIFNKE